MAKTFIDLDIQAKLASATNQIIAPDAIDNSKVVSSAAIAFSKLAALPSAQILVGSGSNVPTAVSVSGELTLANTGALTINNGTITDAKVNASAAIATSKLADSANFLLRGASNTLSNGVRYTYSSPQTFSSDNDLVTKAYVDSVATGLDFKQSVRAATTGNISLSGLQTIDGVSLLANDRVLVKNQSTAADNGIYLASSGAWARSSDADSSAEVNSGMYTFVEEGTTNASSSWVLTTANPITLGTTSLNFAQFSGAGQITAGAGLTKTGNTLDINASATGGLQINADDIQIKLDPNGTLTTTASGLKLTDLPSAQILVGNGSNVATARPVSGDLSMDNTGNFQIVAGSIVNADISASAAIAFSKLASLPSAQILVGSAGNVATATSISGNATLSNAGVLSVTDLTISGQAAGNLLYYNGTNWVRLATGTAHQFLRVNSGATAPQWGNFVDSEKFTADGVTTVFNLANTPAPTGSEHVFLNGVLMDSGAGNDYTISGNQITFLFTPTNGSKIKVAYRY